MDESGEQQNRPIDTALFTADWQAAIKGRKNHPSIVQWDSESRALSGFIFTRRAVSERVCCTTSQAPFFSTISDTLIASSDCSLQSLTSSSTRRRTGIAATPHVRFSTLPALPTPLRRAIRVTPRNHFCMHAECRLFLFQEMNGPH